MNTIVSGEWLEAATKRPGMVDQENARPDPRYESPKALVVLGLFGAFVLFSAVAAYAFFFSRQKVVADTEVWAQFGDYVGGVAGPLIAFLAFIGLLWTIRINYVELKHSREALQQNNSIAAERSRREYREAQKADVYRVIQPLTRRIDDLLRAPLQVPPQQATLSGVVKLPQGSFVLGDLFSDSALVRGDHGNAAARENTPLLEELGHRIDELEPYLRAYERLAGDEFYTGYFKRRFQEAVRFLSLHNVIRRQDTLDFFRTAADVLVAAERAIIGTGDILMDRAIVSGRGTVKGRGDFGEFEIREVRHGEGQELPHVSVHTFPQPNNPDVRLARISWAYASSPPGGVPPSSLAVENKPMTHDDAMEIARRIAKTYGFPYLYEQRDD